jgi:hypothetical protein
MKYILTNILIFLIPTLFSQNLDSLTFNYINQYRIKNGKNSLTWSKVLYVTSINHTNNMVKNDSIYHSHGHYYSENVLYSKNSGLIGDDDYKFFIHKNFNLTYDSVLNNFDVYVATNIVYCWYKSPSHNKIMLSMYKPNSEGSVHVIIKDVVKNNNVIFGKEFFKGYGYFYYKLIMSSTFQLK